MNVLIPITNMMVDEARKNSDIILKNLKNKPNYTGLVKKDRYFIGLLGELVFKKFLDNEGKQYKYNVRLDGRSGGGDFDLYVSNSVVKVVDVKTASKFYYTRMLVPKVQLDNHPNCIYVAVKLNGLEEGEIFGYCYGEDFEIRPKGFTEEKIPTACKNLDDLEKIENLIINVLDKEPTSNYDEGRYV